MSADRLKHDLPEALPIDEAHLGRVVPLVQDRLKLLSEARELTEFFLVDEITYDPGDLVQKKMDDARTLRALEAAESRLDGLSGFDAPELETALRALAEELEVKTGQLFGTLRVACTGVKAAPPLFDTMAVLGRERCMTRIANAIALMRARVAG